MFNVNTPVTFTLPEIEKLPSITLSQGSNTSIYTPNDTVNFPQYEASTQSTTSDEVTVQIVLEDAAGALSLSSTPAGVTATWTVGDGTFEIIGPVSDVNTALGNVRYTSPDGETGPIPYKVNIIDADGLENESCGNNYKLVQSGALSSYEQACAEVTLTGTSGSGAIVVNGVEASGFISFDTDLATTAQNFVSNINANTTTPNYTATYDTGATFTICADLALGGKANGYEVTFDQLSTDLNIVGSPVLGGGATGSLNPRIPGKDSLGDDLFDLITDVALPAAGAISLLTLGDGFDTGKIDVRRDPDNPVRQILQRYRGRNTIPVPTPFDPVNKTFSQTFSQWQSNGFPFKLVYTDDPAWCLYDFIKDKPNSYTLPDGQTPKGYGYGAGSKIILTDTQEEQLLEDLWNASLRNNEDVDGEKRYRIGAIIFDQDNSWEVIKSICSTMHAKPYFDNGLRIFQDRPRDPSNIVNQTLVLDDDSFSYSGTGTKVKFTQVAVGWYDLDKYGKVRKDLIESSNPLNLPQDTADILAWGVNQEGQAFRHAVKVILDDAISDPITVKAIGGAQAHDYEIGEIFRLVDPQNELSPSRQVAGRITNVNSASSIEVSRVSGAAPGDLIQLSLTDGSLHETTISSISGNTITLTNPAPQTPQTDTGYNVSAGRLFKLLRKQEKNAGNQWELVFISHDPNKYNTIDGSVTDTWANTDSVWSNTSRTWSGA